MQSLFGSQEYVKPTTLDEDIKNRRSWVRISATRAATIFLFVGGPAFIVALTFMDKADLALQAFNALLPVAASIVSFWFAGRNDPGQGS